MLTAAEGNRKTVQFGEGRNNIHRPSKGNECLRIAITKVMTKSPQVLLLSVQHIEVPLFNHLNKFPY
jgi:hypothetical protein